jgi:hypothetical protein
MRHYVIAITAAAAVAALPMLASAETPSELDTSCMKAFVATLPHKALITPRTEPTTEHSPLLDSTVEGYVLTARDARSHRVIAQAVCTIDRAGQVKLDHDPLLLASLL